MWCRGKDSLKSPIEYFNALIDPPGRAVGGDIDLGILQVALGLGVDLAMLHGLCVLIADKDTSPIALIRLNLAVDNHDQQKGQL
tara:strand:+ start:408 stop:659 length:252 start_codon:yes stop_codon:yes gene_type:complete